MLNALTAGGQPVLTRNVSQPSAIRGVLVALALSMLLSSLGTSIANVGLPTLVLAFAATFQEVQWVVLAYLLTITSVIVSVGRLGDLVGRRRLLLGGIGLFTAASILCGLASTLLLLIAARALQGMGAAVMMALTLAFVAESVPKERAGRAMGLLATMSAIGTALGPTLGGLLIAGFGWRGIFLVNVPLGIVAFLLAHRFLPMDRCSENPSRARFDGIGTVLLTLTLAAYALAMTIGRGHFGTLNIVLFSIAVGGLAAFIRVQATSSSPLIDRATVGDLTMRRSLATNVLVATVMMATLVIGPFYLSHGFGLDATRVGLVLSIGPMVAALTGLPAGRLVDRFGTRRMTVVGLIGMAVGSVLLSTMPCAVGLVGYIGPIVVMTAGYGLFHTSNNTSVMRNVVPDRRGTVSGLLSLSRNLGLITGASLMGAVFAWASATSGTTATPLEAAARGMRATFGIATALILVALTFALQRGTRAGRN